MMQQAFPEPENNESTLLGIAAHRIAAIMIEGGQKGTHPSDERYNKYINTTCPESNVVINEEIVAGARMYASVAVNKMREVGVFGGEHFGLEKRVYIPKVHPSQFGTPDLWFYVERIHSLYVYDFKFGHRFVNEIENKQMIDYYAGIADLIGINGATDQTLTVHITVVQPRNYHVAGPIRTWTCKGSDLRGHVNKLSCQVHDAFDSDRVRTVTGPHCRDCTAQHACQAAINMEMSTLEFSQYPVVALSTPQQLSTRIAMLERAKDVIRDMLNSLNEQAEQMIRRGQTVPNKTLKPKRANRKWTVPPTLVKQIGSELKIDLERADPVVTPTQAIAMGVPEQVVESLSNRPTGALQLVDADVHDAMRIFGNKEV